MLLIIEDILQGRAQTPTGGTVRESANWRTDPVRLRNRQLKSGWKKKSDVLTFYRRLSSLIIIPALENHFRVVF
jgi:hypothetical protein